jgi:predicted  nucleic acid-binding Zn-ribbon protein
LNFADEIDKIEATKAGLLMDFERFVESEKARRAGVKGKITDQRDFIDKRKSNIEDKQNDLENMKADFGRTELGYDEKIQMLKDKKKELVDKKKEFGA